MATVNVPQEVAEHLEAALRLSTKRVLLRLLDEADALALVGRASAAVLIAGVVLEFLPPGLETTVLDRVQAWRALRHRVAHSAEEATPETASEMIAGLRQLLFRETTASPQASPVDPADAISRLRGKYQFVSTSSADFIERKRQDLRLEGE